MTISGNDAIYTLPITEKMASTNESPRWPIISVTGQCFELQSSKNTKYFSSKLDTECRSILVTIYLITYRYFKENELLEVNED